MPTTSSKQAFDLWLAQGAALPGSQSPGHELLAEHHVMEAVLAAMEVEAETMLTGGSLRPEFWADVVDFNGNFVHMCHRVKEEEHLIPVLFRTGLLEARQEQAIREEHRSGKELTLALCEGVGEADWEKVMRLVSIYVHILRPHMRREETGIFALAATLPEAAQQDLRRAFAAVDGRALGERGRRHFVAIARRLANQNGVGHDLPAG